MSARVCRPGGQIVLVPYDKQWAIEFETESRMVAAVVGNGLLSIHHIGSTAIPGILAKPVIDILAVVEHLDVLDAATSALEESGYEPKGEFGMAGRRYFRKSSRNGIRTHHVHGYQTGSTEIQRHLAFRDYLIAHPEVASKYSLLKRELASRFGSDTVSYSQGKTAFIRGVDWMAGWTAHGLETRKDTNP